MSVTKTSPTPRMSHRRTGLVVLGVLAVVVISALVGIGRDGFGGPLDPSNPKPVGARAVAQVLGDHGVEVRIVRGQEAYLRATIDAETTVVVSNGDALGPSTLRRLERHGDAAAHLLVVAPAEDGLRDLGLRSGDVVGGRLAAGCADPLLEELTVEVPEALGVVGSGCFGDGEQSLLQDVPGPGRTTVLADGALLSNDHVLDADNAAVALRLLGRDRHLVWYVADPSDTVASDAVSVATYLPRWLFPALWLLAGAGVAFLLSRGRRLGPLVTEPMPVIVRAAESTESRGRLYRRTRDREHAAATLRRASRRRLVSSLALPPTTPTDVLVSAVARSGGRDPQEIGRLLADAPVTNDAALADLGRDLTTLEDEVRAP